MALRLLAEIEDRNGHVLSSPIEVASWKRVERLSKVGEYTIRFPLPKIRQVTSWHKNILKVYRLADGQTRSLLSTGIIDARNISIVTTKANLADVSGPNLMSEIGYRRLYQNSDVFGAMAQVPSWELLNAESVRGQTSEFSGDTALSALIALSERAGHNFRLGDNRTVEWIGENLTHSGVRAIAQLGNNPHVSTCLILDLRKISDSADLITRLYVFGGGGVDNRLSLFSLPSSTNTYEELGIDRDRSFIQNDDAVNRYGVIEGEEIFNDISSDDDLSEEDAAIQLLTAAAAFYRAHCVPYESYEMTVTALQKKLKPGDLIKIVYRKIYNSTIIFNINGDFHILEVAESIDEQARHVTSLKVANIARWPTDEASFVIKAIAKKR